MKFEWLQGIMESLFTYFERDSSVQLLQGPTLCDLMDSSMPGFPVPSPTCGAWSCSLCPCSFYAHFLKSLNQKWVLNFVKGFLCIYWDYHMVSIFQFVSMVYHMVDLCILKYPCIPGINPTRSWCMSFLMCWILFAKILSSFASMFISDQFSCSVVSDSLQPHELQLTRPPCPSPTPGIYPTRVHLISDAIQLSHPLLSPSPPTFNLSQHQGLFKWVSSLHQVAKILEFQLQHQSFQWRSRADIR